MINDLIKLATHLDGKGFHGEANYIDSLVRRAAQEGDHDATPADEYYGDYYDEYYDFSPSPDFEFSHGPFSLTFDVSSNPEFEELGDLKSVRIGGRDVAFTNIIKASFNGRMPKFDSPEAQRVFDIMSIQYFDVNSGNLEYGLPVTIKNSKNELVLTALKDIQLSGLLNFEVKSWNLDQRQLEDLHRAIEAAHESYSPSGEQSLEWKFDLGMS